MAAAITIAPATRDLLWHPFPEAPAGKWITLLHGLD
jgi:hypothetical protein